MTNLFRTAVLTVLVAAVPAVAGAGDLKLTIANGRVTIMAQDVPVRQILAEWARIGHTTIINGDKLMGPAVTLQLINQPERAALEILLKSAAGYMAAQRQVSLPEGSIFDRIMILATSRPPAYSASAPPPQFMRPMPQPAPDEDDQPVEPVPMQPPQAPPGTNFPGMPAPAQQQMPLTSPRPGPLPTPAVPQQNPFGTPQFPPGVRPPVGVPGGPGGPGGPG